MKSDHPKATLPKDRPGILLLWHIVVELFFIVLAWWVINWTSDHLTPLYFQSLSPEVGNEQIGWPFPHTPKYYPEEGYTTFRADHTQNLILDALLIYAAVRFLAFFIGRGACFAIISYGYQSDIDRRMPLIRRIVLGLVGFLILCYIILLLNQPSVNIGDIPLNTPVPVK